MAHAKLCDYCLSIQEQLLEDGDGSQVLCEHLLEENDASATQDYVTGEKRVREEDEAVEDEGEKAAKSSKKRKFISPIDFEQAVSKKKCITKWSDLPLKKIYRVLAVHERAVIGQGGESKNVRYGEMADCDGETMQVWLTEIMLKEIKVYDLCKDDIYIRALGLKTSRNGRSYHDFDVIKQ